MSDRRYLFFFFNDTATTEIYTLSLHDALPICFSADRSEHDLRDLFWSHERLRRWLLRLRLGRCDRGRHGNRFRKIEGRLSCRPDRKSTRLNSSHSQISYAVFCLKKKKN